MSDARATSSLPRAFALLGWASLLMSAGVALHIGLSQPLLYLAGTAAVWGAIGLTLLAQRARGVAGRGQRIVLVALLALSAILGLALAATALDARGPKTYWVDSAVFNDVNARLVLDGQNPYTAPARVFWSAVERFPEAGATPLERGRYAGLRFSPPIRTVRRDMVAEARSPARRRGEFAPATLHSYPALAFLPAVPLLALGLPNTALLGALSVLAVILLVAWGLPRRLALASALIVLGNGILVGLTVRGWIELTALVPVLLAFRLLDRRVVSGALIGIACAVKQVVWPLVPILVAIDLRRHGLRPALTRLAASVALFVLANLPFLVAAPGAFASSMLIPVSLPMFPLGVGLTGLSLHSPVPLGPPALYALAELAGFAIVVWLFARPRALRPELALVLFALPFLLGWRGAENYVAFLPIVGAFAVRSRLSSGVVADVEPLPVADAGSARLAA
jgi:hypothetical protein